MDGKFKSDEEWTRALMERFDGLHSRIADLIGERNALQAKCERYEAALKKIGKPLPQLADNAPYMTLVANEALSGEGEKEVDNG
jgi:hypothetical protein